MKATLELNPTWPQVIAVLVAVLEHGTPEGKELARREFRKVGELLDLVERKTREGAKP